MMTPEKWTQGCANGNRDVLDLIGEAKDGVIRGKRELIKNLIDEGQLKSYEEQMEEAEEG